MKTNLFRDFKLPTLGKGLGGGLLTLLLLLAGGCTAYDDSAVWNELHAQAKRIAALEATVNSNISTLQELAAAVQNQRYITDVSAFTAPEPGGYTISFSTGAPLMLWHGAKGETPQIGVKLHTDGRYYWTLNGQWLYDDDDSGEKIPATGDKGEEGEKGDPGITPQLRINALTNEWEVCTNCNGVAGSVYGSWTPLGVKATGLQGPQGDAIFAKNGVDYTTYNDYVEFTLADGATKIQVPKYTVAPEKLGITFDQPAPFGWGITKKVGFTTQGNAASVKVLDVPAGWTVAVTRDGSAGTFTITSPEEDADALEAFVFVSDTAGNVVMRVLKLKADFNFNILQYAASTQLWTIGSQTWSDVIQIPDCDKSDYIDTDTDGNNYPYCRSHTDESGKKRYYYNWKYVSQHAATLCSAPWHVPSSSDYSTLIGVSDVFGLTLANAWGAGGGYAEESNMNEMDTYAYYWSATGYSSGSAYYLRYSSGSLINSTINKYRGMQVRCVK
jgi:hypothetical protein